MNSRIFKILSIFALSALATGCKLVVIVPSGGDVTSASGTKNCVGGSLCEINITDSNFNESFTAVARPGYVFSKWNSGAGFQCANSTNPTCTISNVGTAGNTVVESIIASGQLFYAMPLFDFVGIDTDGDGVKDHLDTDDDNDGVLDTLDNCPLVGPNLDGYGCVGNSTDFVVGYGKAWYQPDLFTNLSYNEIAAACNPNFPDNGACAAGSTLNGKSMTGFKWAALSEVASYWSSNYGYPLMDLSGPDFLNSGEGNCNQSIWGGAYWRVTLQPAYNQIPYLEGLVRDKLSLGLGTFVGRWIQFAPCGLPYWPQWVGRGTAALSDKVTTRGAWFYKSY